MEIRQEIKSKLFHFYKDTFQDLEISLNNLGELDFYLWMNSSQSMITEKSVDSVVINPHDNLEYNTLLLTQEIFEDFGGALNCFIVGYFKQAQALLRNSVELTIQIWKNKLVINEEDIKNNSWLRGVRGIEKVDDTCKEIAKLESSISGIKEKIRKINKLYSRLCMSTHSHKSRLNSINSTRQTSTLKGLTFEPFEFIYTKRIFIYSLTIILDLLVTYFKNQKETDWKLVIIGTLEDEIKRLNNNYTLQNQNYEKSFIIFRESLNISDKKKIELYSIDLDGNFKELTKKKTKLKIDEQKIFRNKLEERLLKDK